MDIKSILINVVISILVAVLTAKLSLKGFYKQELWLKKEQKYSQLLEQLDMLQKYYSDIYDEYIDPNPEKNCTNDFKREYEKAKRDVELLSYGSNLILSNESKKCIKKLLEAMNYMTKDEIQGNYFSYVDRIYGEIKETRENIFKIAKKDLKI